MIIGRVNRLNMDYILLESRIIVGNICHNFGEVMRASVCKFQQGFKWEMQPGEDQ